MGGTAASPPPMSGVPKPRAIPARIRKPPWLSSVLTPRAIAQEWRRQPSAWRGSPPVGSTESTGSTPATLNFRWLAPLVCVVDPARLSSRAPSSTAETIDGSASSLAAEPEEPQDITTDPETLRMVFEAMRLLAAGVAVTYLGYTSYNLTRLELPGVSTVILLDQLPFLTAVLIFVLAHTRRIPEAWVHVLGAVLALSVAANSAVTVRIYGNPGDLPFMIAVAIGGAAIVVSTRWLAFVLAGTLGLTLWAAFGICPLNEFLNIVFIQAGATLVAIVIFLGRVRGQRRIMRLRLRDARTTQELKEALVRAEREFQEHQASEQRKNELVEQLRQAQKLEALGTLAGGVAHDINNVIGAITAIASTTVRLLPAGTQGRGELKQILVAARRGTTLTRNLVRFARQEQPRNAQFYLDEIVLEIEALLRRTLPKHIELRASCGCKDWILMGDSGLIGHAIMNLCLNSADAISEHGSISIETRPIDLDAAEAQRVGVPPGSYVELVVSDDGRGMSPEVLQRAFEPFFSTKSNSRRSGLGLPMVYGTIQQHRGGLKVESEPGRGTTMRVVLPASFEPAAVTVQKPRKDPKVDSLHPLALFVDDELLLRKAGKRMLKSLGYEVMLAKDGQDALQRFKQHRHRIGVVVLDVAMPVMSGAECCAELRRLDPSIPVILATGFPKGHDLQPLLTSANTRYMHKPYELDDLATLLAELGDAFRESTRLSCQVNLVRLSMPPSRGPMPEPEKALPQPARDSVPSGAAE